MAVVVVSTLHPHKHWAVPILRKKIDATRPNQLWVSDFTSVAMWQGFVYVAFVVGVLARRIVGWPASASMPTDLGARRTRAGCL